MLQFRNWLLTIIEFEHVNFWRIFPYIFLFYIMSQLKCSCTFQSNISPIFCFNFFLNVPVCIQNKWLLMLLTSIFSSSHCLKFPNWYIYFTLWGLVIIIIDLSFLTLTVLTLLLKTICSFLACSGIMNITHQHCKHF